MKSGVSWRRRNMSRGDGGGSHRVLLRARCRSCRGEEGHKVLGHMVINLLGVYIDVCRQSSCEATPEKSE